MTYLAPTTPADTPRIEAGVPAIVLAPMEGVTDATMRALLSEVGGFTFCVAEFFRISQAIPGAAIFRKHVPELAHGCRTPTGLPVQIQLLGGDPDKLAEAALVAVRLGARAVDLNFGCPAPTVNRHDGGATLLRYPDRLRAIVAAVRQAVPAEFPVSAKLRLGWDDIRAIHVNAERAAEGGADWLTIHARTKTQGYRPPAYWKPIGEVRARLDIPVVANGEIWTLDDLRRCRDETGCEHFMLGRGAVADPMLARVATRELGIGGAVWGESFAQTPALWLPLVKRFAELRTAHGRTDGAILARVKQWFRMADHNGRLAWFDELKRQDGLAELLDHLRALAPSTI
ncbi:MAG TPA: tRNA-dihydrouridine synthase family protein, partial [Gemmataceae bacterium]|nr:tRNA-dihydrouridine synthase family protein [Gemmataceae bacterium]